MSPFEFASDPFAGTGAAPTGFGTPASDTTPQVCYVPPRRVIPIVFLPGIMGSNLRIKSETRIQRLRRRNDDPERNIAWRPDTFGLFNASEKSHVTPAERQLLLDPSTTEVDLYNADSIDPKRDGDERHRNVRLSWKYVSPLLTGDHRGGAKPRTAAQKARMRGWGEVYFGSYGELLQRVESRMQTLFVDGRLADGWDEVVGVDPGRWQPDPATPQKALTVDEFKAITKETCFPVHAVGYNWLVSNQLNADEVGDRVRQLVQTYRAEPTHECPGVIVVTHSMGGLLGRALVHPAMGGLNDLVLGIVHGVQPATGAAAAYRRMRAGFEDPGLVRDAVGSITAKIGGNYGDEVTAVLASSPGALQLLPSKAYGNGWLTVKKGEHELLNLPARGDPYEEIYKLRGKWFGLIADESWLNPAGLTLDGNVTPIQQAHRCLDSARDFHDMLADTYHAHTYVHYGADRQRLAYGSVTWQIGERCVDVAGWDRWQIGRDSRQGSVEFTAGRAPLPLPPGATVQTFTPGYGATIAAPDEPGDQTVPVRSADRQRLKGNCRAVFRQTGYEHQASYKDEAVLSSTLYCILRIAQRVQVA